jgi:hypothetical protein
LTRPTIAPRGHQVITYKVPLKEGIKVAKLESNLWYKIAYEELVIKTLHRNIPIPKFLLTNDTLEIK